MRTRSRAAVLPLLAGLVLLCSATRAQAFGQSQQPVSIVVGNSSSPLQIHAWSSPNKSLTLGALVRTFGGIAGSSNPLNETKAVAKGLALYERETAALIKGRSNLVKFVPASSNSTSPPAGDLRCFVDPATGQLVGLEQSGSAACSTGGDVVVVPTSSGYVSQIMVAYTYDGLFVGRLVFDLRANATVEPMSYSCGSAGGKAVEVLPVDESYVVTRLGVGCSPLPANYGVAGRRRRLQAAGTGLGVSAGGFGVDAAPLAALPIDPATGLPKTQSLGDILEPAGALPPTVALSTASLAQNAPTLIITGTGFDASSPSANAVVLSSGAAGAVTASTLTSLVVILSTLPTSVGAMTGVVTSFGLSSGAPVQVASVVAAPVVALSSASLAQSAPTLTVTGSGFDPTAAGNTVVLTLGAVGTVTSATTTSLIVTLSPTPTAGLLTAVVTSFGGSSGAAVTVATVVAAPIVAQNLASIARSATTLIITGTGFDTTTLSANLVSFSGSAVGTVTSAPSSSTLTVTFSTMPSLGPLTAIVTSFGGSSGAAVVVARIVAAPVVTQNLASLANNVPTLTITGTGFDPSAAGNTVVLTLGAVGAVTSATTTSLTVTLSTLPNTGLLTAVVTSFGGSTGAAVTVATVVAAPVVTPSTASIARSAATLTITGSGFDPTAAGNTVVLTLGAVGVVTSATTTSLTVTLSPTPTAGLLTAVVTSFGRSSGAAVAVATVVAAPVVAQNLANLADNVPMLTITGTGFDPTAAGNTLVLTRGANGTVTSATTTSLTVTLSTLPTSTGLLTAVVTSFGGPSGAAVTVATVVAAPVVAQNLGYLADNVPTLTIMGTGFDPSAAGNTVALTLGAVGAVTSATTTSLTVTFSTLPTTGLLTAVVTSFGGPSGAAVTVATVVAAPVVAQNLANRAKNALTLTITGTGFDPSAAGNTVVLTLGAVGTVTSATTTSLTVTFSTLPTMGLLTAVVTSFGRSSGAAVAVATVVAAPVVAQNLASLANNVPMLTITGTGFDPTAAGNTVVLTRGANGTVTSATTTSLSVTLSTLPTSTGLLTAVVTSFGGSSGAAVVVATVRVPPSVSTSSVSLSNASTTLVISGANFDPSAAGNVLTLSSGTVGSISAASSTSLTILFSTSPGLGPLSASVTSFGLSSGAAVQVANVVVPWTVVGTAGFSATGAVFTSLAIDKTTGTPYLAYVENNQGAGGPATAQKFSGGNWTVLGTIGFSAGRAEWTSLALDSMGTPFVAYRDGAYSRKATVQRFATGSGWTAVGAPGFSAGEVAFTSLAFNTTSGTLFIAYQDGSLSNKATVQKLVGGSWTVVGAAGFSAGTANWVSLAIDSTGTPFVAYQDGSLSNKATVQKLVGGSWSVVGTAGFSSGSSEYISIAIDSMGTPFVAYPDGADGFKATAQKFVTGSGWAVVGSGGFSAGGAAWMTIALDSTGAPFVAYYDATLGGKLTIQKFAAGSWTVVGTPGFSAGISGFNSLAFDTTGTPFVAYSDSGNGNRATVQKNG